MREIKFEFIWKYEKSLAKGIYTLSQIQQGCANPPKSRSNGVVRCWELIATRQFTGLKDANGVEIYEGDIICAGNEKYKGIVIFHDGTAEYLVDVILDGKRVCRNKVNEFISKRERAAKSKCLVIGNIHETKSEE